MRRWQAGEGESAQSWLAVQRGRHAEPRLSARANSCECGICRPDPDDPAIAWADVHADLHLLTADERPHAAFDGSGGAAPILPGYRPLFRRQGGYFTVGRFEFADAVVCPGQDFSALLAFGSPEMQLGIAREGSTFALCDGGQPRASGTVTRMLRLEPHAREGWARRAPGRSEPFDRLVSSTGSDLAALRFEKLQRLCPWLTDEILLDPGLWANDDRTFMHPRLWLDGGWRVERFDARDGVVFLRRQTGPQ